MSKEIWKPILDWEEFYEVSTLGNVRGIPRMFTRVKLDKKQSVPVVKDYRYLTPIFTGDRSPQVCLHKKGKSYSYSVAYLVMIVFKPEEIPKGKTRFDFIFHDGNSNNCRLSNLEWRDKSKNRRMVLGIDKKTYHKIYRLAEKRELNISQYITALIKETK